MNDIKIERINKAIGDEERYNNEYNAKLRKEEIEGNFKYDKSVFKYRRSKCSYKSAVEYIKKYYSEIKISKKKLGEMLKESDVVKYAGAGSIGFQSSSFNGFGRTGYDLIDMDSVDQFAVECIYGGN